MANSPRRRSALRVLLGNFWFGLGALAAPAGAAPAPAAADDIDDIDETDDGDESLGRLLAIASEAVDPAMGGHRIAVVLEQLPPLEATRVAAIAAGSAHVAVRVALAEALTWELPLVGADVVLDHLSRDPEQLVRFAVARAAHARRASLGDEILLRLARDPDALVAGTARFAIGMPRI